MDGREGMPSFYLNRGVSGSGHNAGPGNHGGGLHQPPPGFKTQSNPYISPHGHGHMRVASATGSSFQLEHNSSQSFRHDIGGGGGGGGGGVAVSGGSHGSGNDPVVKKKKRGRPRKYGPVVAVALALTPPAAGSPGSISAAPKKNRGRPPGSGRKQRLADVGEWMHNSAGSAFTPHIIHISIGEDVAEKILSFAQRRPRALCVLSGSGAISTVTLRQFTSSGGNVTYEGRFEILRLSGSYLLAGAGGPHNRTGGLSISVCSADGQVVGGAIGGRLIASSLIRVVVCSFVYGDNNSKSNVKIDAAPGDETSSENPKAIAWLPDSSVDFTKSHTEIDLTRG